MRFRQMLRSAQTSLVAAAPGKTLQASPSAPNSGRASIGSVHTDCTLTAPLRGVCNRSVHPNPFLRAAALEASMIAEAQACAEPSATSPLSKPIQAPKTLSATSYHGSSTKSKLHKDASTCPTVCSALSAKPPPLQRLPAAALCSGRPLKIAPLEHPVRGVRSSATLALARPSHSSPKLQAAQVVMSKPNQEKSHAPWNTVSSTSMTEVEPSLTTDQTHAWPEFEAKTCQQRRGHSMQPTSASAAAPSKSKPCRKQQGTRLHSRWDSADAMSDDSLCTCSNVDASGINYTRQCCCSILTYVMCSDFVHSNLNARMQCRQFVGMETLPEDSQVLLPSCSQLGLPFPGDHAAPQRASTQLRPSSIRSHTVTAPPQTPSGLQRPSIGTVTSTNLTYGSVRLLKKDPWAATTGADTTGASSAAGQGSRLVSQLPSSI